MLYSRETGDRYGCSELVMSVVGRVGLVVSARVVREGGSNTERLAKVSSPNEQGSRSRKGIDQFALGQLDLGRSTQERTGDLHPCLVPDRFEVIGLVLDDRARARAAGGGSDGQLLCESKSQAKAVQRYKPITFTSAHYTRPKRLNQPPLTTPHHTCI